MARRNSLKDEWKFEPEKVLDGQSIAIDSIVLPASQPRRYFDPQKLQQLTESVRQHGILEPLLVRPVAGTGNYELVAGERRYRAAREVGLTSIPVTIRELTDEAALQLALVENLQREDLNPVEEAEGILQLLGLRLKMSASEVPSLLYRMRNQAIGKVNQNVLINSEVQGKVNQNVLINSEVEVVQSVLAEVGTIGWESFVTSRLPLITLPQEVLEALRSGKIAYTKAQAIARIKDETQRQALLQAAIQDNLSLNQIKEQIKASSPEVDRTAPKTTIESLSRRLVKAKLWEDPKKWKQAQALLEKLEALVSEDELRD